MARTKLDHELHVLDVQVLQLGTLAENALNLALEALESTDQDKSGAVIASDTTIDTMDTTIEEHVFRVLMLQQPLAGRDLRYLTSIQPVTIDLERIGDEAESIAQNVLHMVPLRNAAQQTRVAYSVTDATGTELTFTEEAVIQNLLVLGRKVQRLLQGTMKAFAERDAVAARGLWQEDGSVDRGGYRVRRDLMALLEGAQAIPALQHDSFVLQRATYMLWIAHELERMADHCTNVCERIVFIVDGEVHLHSPMTLPSEA